MCRDLDAAGFAKTTPIKRGIFDRHTHGYVEDFCKPLMRERKDSVTVIAEGLKAVMEANTEDPLSTREIAAQVNISLRELERQFRRWLVQSSPPSNSN